MFSGQGHDEEAAADKARYMEELKAYQEYRIAHLENIGGSLSHHGLETEPGELVLPLARIKRIAKRLFKDVRKKEVQRKKG